MRPRRSAPKNPWGHVCRSNLFPFNSFRTLHPQWSSANPFSSITSTLFYKQRRGRGLSSKSLFLNSSFLRWCPASTVGAYGDLLSSLELLNFRLFDSLLTVSSR